MKFQKILTICTLSLFIAASFLMSGGDAEAAKKVKLRILKAGAESAWDNYYEEAIERFQETHPDVMFEYSSVGWADANTKINTLFAGNAAPDIIAAAVGYLAVRADIGQFLALDDYYKAWAEKDLYQEGAYQKGLYKGKFYGLGYHWDPRVFVYRKDLFKKAGLDPEKPPTSWEELAEYAEKTTIKDGDVVTQSGFALPTSQTRVVSYIFLNQNGTMLADEANAVPQFDDPLGIETIEYLTDLYKKGVSAPFAGNKASEDPFQRGIAAMGYTTPSQLNNFVNNYPELADEIGFVYNIQRKAKATFGGMYQLFITNQSKNPDTAWEFMAFMMSKDETVARMEALNSPPTRSDMKDEYLAFGRFNGAIWEAAQISNPWPNVTWSALYRNYLNKAFEEAFLGAKDPKDALISNGELLQAEIDKM